MDKTVIGRSRYTVLWILSVTWIVSFMDRSVIPITIPYIAKDYGLSPLAMGAVMSAFFISYSISQIPGGLLADKFPVRTVATITLLWWSAFTALTGATVNFAQILIARFGFGLGEGMFPACAFKTIALWFPKEERASANAIMFACGPLGACLAPLILVHILSHWGWRPVFFSLLLPGAMALLSWTFIPSSPPKSSRSSLDGPSKIKESGEDGNHDSDMSAGIFDVLKSPNILKCLFILFAFDLAGWGFGTWLPTYLIKARGFSMGQMGAAASLPPLAAIAGSLFGGWASEKCFRNCRWVPIVATQLASALLLYLIYTVNSTPMLVICQILTGLCIGAFSTAFWAIPMNMVPVKLMGVTSGVINTAGQIAAFVSPITIGYLVGAAGGNFHLAFAFLIVSVLMSCAFVIVLPSKWERHHYGVVPG